MRGGDVLGVRLTRLTWVRLVLRVEQLTRSSSTKVYQKKPAYFGVLDAPLTARDSSAKAVRRDRRAGAQSRAVTVFPVRRSRNVADGEMKGNIWAAVETSRPIPP